MNSRTTRALQLQRSIHLIDIETLCGSANPTALEVFQIRSAYLELVRPGQFDQFYVTVSSRQNLEAASFGWPSARVACKEGHDGADILIAKELLENRFEKTFNKIYLASGDGGLAPFAKHVVSKGGKLLVVSLPRSLSKQMRQTGAQVLYLSSPKGMVP
jgi:hypothetical protein